jgi:hypothetical protein
MKTHDILERILELNDEAGIPLAGFDARVRAPPT